MPPVPLLLLGLAVAAEPSATLAEFLGVNGHTITFRAEPFRPVARQVRDYHPFDWDVGQNAATVPPFPFAANRVDWAKVYGSWRAAGHTANVCIMFDQFPRSGWTDLAADAERYGEHFARSFGPSAAVPLVASVEVGNEPGLYSDADYRTIFAAMAKGLRRGDPKLRVLPCAMTPGKSHRYAKSLSLLEGLGDLYDAVGVHVYAQLEDWPTWRRGHPEHPQLKSYLNEVRATLAWRDAHAKGKPVWVTEFGWDASTKKPQPKGDFAQWVGNTEAEQAQWLARSTLIFMRMGVARGYVFFHDDKDEPRLHGSSGLTRDGVPKPAFHALTHLQRALGDYRFRRAIREDADGYAYEFEPAGGVGARVLVAWSPTAGGRSGTLELPAARVARAERLALTAGTPEAVPITQAGGALRLPITETPLLVWVD